MRPHQKKSKKLEYHTFILPSTARYEHCDAARSVEHVYGAIQISKSIDFTHILPEVRKFAEKYRKYPGSPRIKVGQSEKTKK